jgi:colanic acid/amylovoran biosynthesis glycosyltransferase
VQPVRLAYVVSRFPHVSETFILRELNALDADADLEIELGSLFPALDTTVHEAAEPWLGRLHRPGVAEGLRGLAWWLVRRPLRLASSLATLVAGSLRSPAKLARSLATFPIAAAHARRMGEHGVDHVHAHYATYPALTAWLTWRLTEIGYSFTAHAHDLFVDQTFLATKVRDARFVVAVSEFNRGFLSGYGGESETPVHVVHCGIDPGEFPYRPRQPPPSGPVTALCVASLQEYKGHTVLLEALAAGGEELRRVTLELVGDGPLRGGLEASSRTLGLADRVRFRGSLSERGVHDALERADLYVLPSVVAADGQMDGLPVALMEALASGLPVIATRLSGIPEIVNGTTGLLAEPADPASLAAALHTALAGDAGVDQDAGRALVESEFDVRHSAAQLARLFHATVSA